ncbi:HD domain-containing protein [Streptomyces sp. NPDC059575]|uniref:HD domain-containing protein n=1 Tax=Streptomyces sp. NPDC059575 TaxID=3346872 RepID=UPI003692E02C
MDTSREPAWNPLVAEMLTAASVMLELWDRVLSPRQRAHLAERLGTQDEQSARPVTGFLAGVSRIGHASPAHMTAFGSDRPHSPALDTARITWRAKAIEAGLPLPFPATRVRHAHHEHITAAVLPRLTGCDCPAYVDGEHCRDKEHRGLYTAAFALNRHGADILHADTVAKAYRATGGPAWHIIRTALVDDIARHVELDAKNLFRIIQPERPLRLTAFTGLVSQSTALSRGNTAQAFASPDDTWTTMSNNAHLNAKTATTSLRIIH